jgi:hypothetical protein
MHFRQALKGSSCQPSHRRNIIPERAPWMTIMSEEDSVVAQSSASLEIN